MARIIFPADNVGEAKAYIKALTGVASVTIPTAPDPELLGTVLKVESKFISASASADIGFGYGSASGDADVKVLLQDYWFSCEVESEMPEVNSWTYAVGFRVGLQIVKYKTELNVGIGVLAAKAQTEGLNIQLQVLRVGMPHGPAVPVDLAMPVSLDVDKFGNLKAWETDVLNHIKDNRAQLRPVLVSASVNINADKLLNDMRGVRFAMWRIAKGVKLKEALNMLASGKAPDVSTAGPTVRSIYSAIFRDSTMVIPGSNSEDREPSKIEKDLANKWLEEYKNV